MPNHEASHIGARFLSESSPEILGSSVSVGMLLEVVRNPVQECFNSEVTAEHTDSAAALYSNQLPSTPTSGKDSNIFLHIP